MLLQRSSGIRLWWEGDSARLVVANQKNVQTHPASWSPPLQEWQQAPRRRVKLSSRRKRIRAVTILCSQGILPREDNSKDVRGSDQAGDHSRLDGSDVRVASPSVTGNAGSDARGDVVADLGVSDTTGRPSNSGGVQDVEYARSGFLTDRARVSVERFAMAREAGRELVRGTEADEEGLYYNPKVGDYVIGTVASGNYGKLDIDIGARKLAHLFRKDVMPLDICNVRERSWAIPDALDGHDGVAVPCDDGPRYVYDEEVLNLALEIPMVAERGTVFTLEVKGFTPAGIALLSARSVARGYAWQRVRQLHEHQAILKVQITEWTAAGLVAKIEGLRAFLPFYYLLNRPPESSTGGSVSYIEYVGQIVSVMITTVDEMRCNLVISEKKAWMTKNAYIGALVDGIVTDIHTYGLHLQVKNTDLSGILHISNISRARIDNIECLFCVGEQVKVMIVPSNIKRKLSFSTADLEIEDGLMLRDKEAVYQGAEKIAGEIARAYKKSNSESTIDSDDNVDAGEQEIVIANWDWLDFGDKTNVDYNLPL